MTVAVVEAVSSAETRDPTQLPPLYHAVDADALDTLFESDGDSGCTVSFAYSDSYVTIEHGERILVEPNPGAAGD